LESTLSGRAYIRLFQRARQLGYGIEIHYLWLSSPAHAVARVRNRVQMGGHDVPAADIRRRFTRSHMRLVEDYLPLSARWAIWDSREFPVKQLAASTTSGVDSVRKIIGL